MLDRLGNAMLGQAVARRPELREEGSQPAALLAGHPAGKVEEKEISVV
jgi:hypothetical protein